MLHAFGITLLTLVMAKLLAAEFQPKADLRTHLRLLIAAVVVTLTGYLLDQLIGGKLGNFFLHMVGGGMPGALVFAYLLKTFNVKWLWLIELIVLYFWVSGLGVLNELFEFGLELAGVGIQSIDTQDTWRDFVANSLGAGLAWVALKLVGGLGSGKKQG